MSKKVTGSERVTAVLLELTSFCGGAVIQPIGGQRQPGVNRLHKPRKVHGHKSPGNTHNKVFEN